MEFKNDCKYFKGDVPCLPHKEHGLHCDRCDQYSKISHRILIIKMGAAGDVIRTTPLLEKIAIVYPKAHITWITDFPDLVPSGVDVILNYSVKNIAWLQQRSFDIVYSLDKDKEAIALAESVRSGEKHGFGMDLFGRTRAFNAAAEHKLYTGIFDDTSRNNVKSYPEEIFELCGFEFSGEEYVLRNESSRVWNIPHDKKIVGLNTGCGGRWTARLWKDENWIALAVAVKKNGMEVLWLGGEQEDQKNRKFQQTAGGIYPGFFPFNDFISLVDQADIIVTQVTMAMHIAIGLKKQLVLMNNIFNKNEFEMYGRGEIVEPAVPCGCYYTPVCPHDSMSQITPEMILNSIEHHSSK